jgi:hypothetical protein
MRYRYKFIVCFPNSSTPVATFKTLKAAKAHSDQLVDDQMFQYQFFGNKVYLPFIKRELILKGNTNGQKSTTA